MSAGTKMKIKKGDTVQMLAVRIAASRAGSLRRIRAMARSSSRT